MPAGVKLWAVGLWNASVGATAAAIAICCISSHGPSGASTEEYLMTRNSCRVDRGALSRRRFEPCKADRSIDTDHDAYTELVRMLMFGPGGANGLQGRRGSVRTEPQACPIDLVAAWLGSIRAIPATAICATTVVDRQPALAAPSVVRSAKQLIARRGVLQTTWRRVGGQQQRFWFRCISACAT